MQRVRSNSAPALHQSYMVMTTGNNIVLGHIHVDSLEQLEALRAQNGGLLYIPSLCGCDFYAQRQSNSNMITVPPPHLNQ